MQPLEVETPTTPTLADGIARCLDNFVFLDQTQEELYGCLRQELQLYYQQVQAYNMAQRLRAPNPKELDKAIMDILADVKK